jgi:hypothetical protein
VGEDLQDQKDLWENQDLQVRKEDLDQRVKVELRAFLDHLVVLEIEDLRVISAKLLVLWDLQAQKDLLGTQVFRVKTERKERVEIVEIKDHQD